MNNADWVNSAVRGAIPAIVVLSLLLCRKWFPSKAANQKINWDSDALHSRFRPLPWKVWPCCVAVMIIFAFGTWFLLSRTNLLLAKIDTPQAIHLLPQPAMWWFFPGFGALTFSWEITLQIFSCFLGRETVNLYNDWVNNTTRGWVRSRYTGIDSRRVLRWMAVGIALPILLFVLLALPMHANVGPKNIRDCGYALKPCSVYPLADVVRITEISGFRDKSGKLIDRAGLVLDFKDGHRWSSAEWGDWENSVNPNLTNFLLNKTGLPLGYATTEKDISNLSPDSAQR